MNIPEVWLRGPLDDIPALAQPVAHALLQAREEITEMTADFPGALLWEHVAGMASPGFHLQHLSGVLDRLFTYARGEQLNELQLSALTAEGKPVDGDDNLKNLVEAFNSKIDDCIVQLKTADVKTLTDRRGVGRANLPSTVIGLYTHAAEHTMRHTGQLLVTLKVLAERYADDVDSRLIT